MYNEKLNEIKSENDFSQNYRLNLQLTVMLIVGLAYVIYT